MKKIITILFVLGTFAGKAQQIDATPRLTPNRGDNFEIEVAKGDTLIRYIPKEGLALTPIATNRGDHFEIEVDAKGDTLMRLVPKEEGLALTPIASRLSRASVPVNYASAARSYYGAPMNLGHIPMNYTPSTTAMVGEIPIQYALGSMGNVTYNVPIDVLPGRNGMQPSLSFAYNSLAGNGQMGIGWSVSGLSCISAAGKKQYYDGETGAPSFLSENYTYELDGMRLIHVKDKNYESEHGNIQITKGYGIDVRFPNGNIGRYDPVYVPTSRDYSLYYPLAHIHDMLGNDIWYQYRYSGQNSRWQIHKIIYGANFSQEKDYSASVEFVYKDRTDKIPFYQSGVKFVNNQLLSSVIVKSGTSIVRTYNLTYTYYRNAPQLTKIECLLPNNKSLNPLLFYYGEQTPSTGLNSYSCVLGGPSFTNPRLQKAKFDIRSASDALIYYPTFKPYTTLREIRSGSYTFYQLGSGCSPNQILYVYNNLTSPAIPIQLTAGEGFQLLTAGDYMGDGNDRLIQLNSTYYGLTIRGYKVNSSTLSTERSFTIPSRVVLEEQGLLSAISAGYLTGDFMGTGKINLLRITHNKDFRNRDWTSVTDLVDIEKQTSIAKFCPFGFTTNDQLLALDYDGDGKTDICHVTGSNINIYTFKKDGSLLLLASLGINLLNSSRQFMFADVNGDGKTDILMSPYENYIEKQGHIGTCKGCCYSESNKLTTTPTFTVYSCNGSYCEVTTKDMGSDYWSVYLSKGANGFESTSMKIIRNEKGSSYIMQDMNNDGLPDLVVKDTYFVRIYLNVNGTINTYAENQSLIVDLQSKLIPGNILQDHKMSQLFSINGTTLIPITYARDDTKQKLLTGVIDSKGILSLHRYLNVLSESNYTMGAATANYPYSQFYGNLNLASQMNVYRGTQDIATLSYAYERAIINKQGLGFCGFTKVTSTNSTKGQTITQTFDPLRFGVMEKEETPVGTTTNTYTVSVASNKKATVQLLQTEQKNTLLGTTAKSSYTYDAYSNPTKETVVFDATNSKVTDNVYNNVNGQIGRLDKQTVTQKRNADTWVESADMTYNVTNQVIQKVAKVGTNITSQQKWTYDGVGNMLSESSLPYASTDWLTTVYTYDATWRFVLTEKDPMGLITKYEGHNVYGQATKITDYKNNITNLTYDDVGRLIKTVRPNGVTATTAYNWKTVANTNIMFATEETSTGEPKKTTYLDALGRTVRTSVVGFDGKEIHVDQTYDAQGRPSATSEPHLGAASRWTKNTYDVYDRLTQVIAPSGKTVKYSYDKLATTTNDAGLESTSTKDAIGLITSIKDPAGTISYAYRPDGQASNITAPNKAVTSFAYDVYGRQTSITDPSAGVQKYEYDVAGRISKQTDANNKVQSNTYNKFGMLLTTVAPEMTTTYTYSGTDYLLTKVVAGGTSLEYTYDNLLRKSSETETTGGIALKQSYTYTAGKLSKLAYSTAVDDNLEYVYNVNGYLSTLKWRGSAIKTINTVNHFGQTTQYSLGNGVKVSRTFTVDGLPSRIQTTDAKSANIQDFIYSFNAHKGELTSRKDNLRDLTESFTYDVQHRLTSFGLPKKLSEMVYDEMGNITTKSDAGVLSYATVGKPYAISKQAGNSGSVAPRLQNVTYTAFQRPAKITESSNTVNFTYGIGYERNKMEVVGKYSRHYLAGCYERDVPVSGAAIDRLYLGGTAYSAPVVLTRAKSTDAWTIQYLHRDHLGSITAITNGTGAKIAEYSFDPWGRQRDPATLVAYLPDNAPALLTGRGFTGHEHLPQFGLINMNARLYDPVLGRFLSPDPYVQAPDWSQSFNRYTYCGNNPLMYIDQNGEMAWFVPVIIGAVLGAYSGGTIANQGEFNPTKWDFNSNNTWMYMLGGAVVGGASGGIGWGVSTSGMPMANTLGIASASLVNSVGTSIYTGGQTSLSISFGVASYNFDKSEWGYLGKKGNSFAENLGYSFGAIANSIDLVSLATGGGQNISINSANTKDGNDWWGHSSITDENGTSLVSVGPAGAVQSSKNLLQTYKNSITAADIGWDTYVNEIGTWRVSLNNVSTKIMTNYSSKVTRWDLLLNSCVGHTSKALWMSGVPNILALHPHILNFELTVIQLGIYSNPYLYHPLNKK